jgi:hypothetical protein
MTMGSCYSGQECFVEEGIAPGHCQTWTLGRWRGIKELQMEEENR